jgi:hypothetical protein
MAEDIREWADVHTKEQDSESSRVIGETGDRGDPLLLPAHYAYRVWMLVCLSRPGIQPQNQPLVYYRITSGWTRVVSLLEEAG